MTVPVSPAPVPATLPARAGRSRFGASARALVQLSWARTMSPLLIVSMIGLVVLPMLFALLFVSRRESLPAGVEWDPVAYLVKRFDQFVCALATPVIALLLGTSAFSAEADDGTLLYVVTTTTPRWWICTVRVLFAAVLTALLSSIAVVGSGIIVLGADDPMHVVRAFAIAAAFGGATYAALFTAFALVNRRALVLGLGYVLFWEGILSSTFPGLHYLSVRQWMLAVAATFTDASSKTLDGGPSVTVSVIMAGVVFLLAIAIGATRLDRPRLSRVGT